MTVFRFLYLPSGLLESKSPDAYTEKYHCKPEQDACFRQDIDQTAAAYAKI